MKEAAALKYNPEENNAPVVVAGGRGSIAEKIIKLAEENDIPLFKDENTAHVLCSLPAGEEIPVELYQAVAEIYAFILKVSFENYSKGKISENK